MKRFLILVSAVTVFSMVLAACGGDGGAPTEAATQVPAIEPGAVPATDAPAIVPIDLAGPPMEVGSLYSYVDGSILAAVPGGPFVMGYNFFDNLEREVVVGDFWIYTNEVTNAQYGLCVALGQCTAPDQKDNPGFDNYRFVSFPVVGVTHQQAVDYCTFVHGRLPTEAEWEKAARGPEGNLFPWGDGLPECSLLNYDYCENGAITVKSYPQGVSFYGLFDMAGNIREWVADWYDPDTNADGSIADPLGSELGQKRSIRSSSFADSTDFAIAAHRFSLKPEESLPDLGFRCVVEDPTFYAPYCQTNVLYGSDGQGNPTDDLVQISENCIQPGIDYDPDCEIQVTRLKVFPAGLPPGSINLVDPAGACSPNGDQKYICDGSGEAGGSLTVTPPECEVIADTEEGGCPPPYVEAPDPENPDKMICVGQGLGENCRVGFTYNALLSCCTAENSGQTQSYDCPPGFDKVGDDCVNNQSGDPAHEVSQDFGHVAYCAPPENGGDPGCTVPVDPGCSYPMAWDGQCGCYCSWGPGKCP